MLDIMLTSRKNENTTSSVDGVVCQEKLGYSGSSSHRELLNQNSISAALQTIPLLGVVSFCRPSGDVSKRGMIFTSMSTSVLLYKWRFPRCYIGSGSSGRRVKVETMSWRDLCGACIQFNAVVASPWGAMGQDDQCFRVIQRKVPCAYTKEME